MKRCTFCEIGAGRMRSDAKVYEDERVIAFFDQAPVAEYHTLVVPKRHSTNVFDVEEDDLIAVAVAIRHICRMYRSKLGIEDLQIVSSNGAAAQQDAFHLHFHIVPRAHGDGQNITWTPDFSILERFDNLLSRLDTGRASH